ncbi:MAG: hypothetical protein WAP51_04890 [Candidatus Sungiibacteriota bacterium]
MSQRAVLISLLVIIFVAGIAAFFVFGGQKTLQEAPTTLQLPGGGGSKQPNASAPLAVTPQGGEITPTQSQQEQKNAVFLTFFGTSVKIPTSIFEVVKPLLPAATKEVVRVGAAPVASGAIPATKPLTEKEVFERIWPQEYRDYLKEIEGFMVEDGFIGVSQRRTFLSDQDIFDFIELMFAYARQKGWITDEEFKKFTADTKGDFLKLIRDEQDALRRGEVTGILLPGYQRFTRYSAGKLIRDMLDGIGYVIMQAKPAYAGWNTGKDCYKDDDPDNKKKGFNSKVFCCNCGYFCTPTGCVFKEDCGEKGKSCNVQLGCLNGVCGDWPNAIWDKESGTCGCG